jgi:exopolyphosphatase/guanosine-5'-triphosphate,3'-diphosphate pyrophosphatase
MVARYHRRALPGTSHLDYAALSREDRLVVNKLAAILRVADALDRTHTETIRDIKVIPEEDQVLIEIKGRNDLVTEKRALSEKGVMFEQVYGRPIVLRSKRK